ncbi:MAG: hypothetical protein U0103_17520 [Candidatus Obscuribacterales bacterium]|jgi:hypothetical protein|nr:hypothetical protein [Cyanobacteria bacterium SZAS LIN-5]RTL40364.1 MAG: hypothetical protein EKK48_16590 [Candidatus Melainabacteria bacterium]
MRTFDLIEYQRDARSRKQPRELFALWEEVCHHYDRGLIGQYDLDEMKAVIWPNLHALSVLKSTIDHSFRTAA